MKNKTTIRIISICILILSVTLATAYVASPQTKEKLEETTTTIYLYPTNVPTLPINENFTVDLCVADVTDLYTWSLNMTWDSSILNCTSFTYNYSWFGPQINVIALPGTINNTKGAFDSFYAASLTTDHGKNDSGSIAEIGFQAVGYGTTSINISMNAFLNSSGPAIPYSTINSSFTLLPPHGPTAVKTHTPDPPHAKSLTMFNASGSQPGFNGSKDVPIANYSWIFGDDNTTTVTTPIIYHNYTAAGNYTVSLTVTCQDDPTLIANDLTSDTTSQNITVQPPLTRIFVSPASIVGPPPTVGETFTVNINVADVTDLYTWNLGLSWNSSILNCTSFTYNYSWFGPEASVLTLRGNISNTEGRLHPLYAASLFGDHGMNDSGTLAHVTFLVKDFGTSWINLTVETFLNSSGKRIPYSLVNASFSLLDTTPPTISAVTQNPAKTEVDADEAVTVTATVTDTDSGVHTILLKYSTDNVTFTTVTMTLSTGNNYTAQIPGQAADTYVSYKIFANDTVGNPDETELYWYRVKSAEVPPSNLWLWIAIGIAIAVVIILVVVYLMRRKPA